jgi:hypothetical protein
MRHLEAGLPAGMFDKDATDRLKRVFAYRFNS